MLVEDDPEIRMLVDTVLSAEGHRVVTTGDPTRAVEMVRAESPDLVICDIMMPVMDGYAVLRALQSDPSTSRYPVMFLTARQEFDTETIFAIILFIMLFVALTEVLLFRPLQRRLDRRYSLD